MPTKKEMTQLIEIASQLEQWALVQGVLDDPYVDQLFEALRSGKKLDFWANYSAVELLPKTSEVAENKLQKTIRLVNQFRNVMVFAPVAFTWASISVAATSYSRYSKEHNNINLNFLDFWENGYSAMASIWKLSNVAIIDFLIIFSIILASVASIFLENRSHDEYLNNSKSNESQRLSIALRIDEALHSYQKPTPQLVNSSINASVQNLKKASDSLLFASKDFNKESKLFTNFNGVLKKLDDLKRQIDKP